MTKGAIQIIRDTFFTPHPHTRQDNLQCCSVSQNLSIVLDFSPKDTKMPNFKIKSTFWQLSLQSGNLHYAFCFDVSINFPGQASSKLSIKTANQSSTVLWKAFNVITVTVTNCLLWSYIKVPFTIDSLMKLISYCYNLVNVVKKCLVQKWSCEAA